jgi:pyruvate,water dikinase
MSKGSYVHSFENIRLKDIPELGGKNASLGALHGLLATEGGREPDGFALRAQIHRDALTFAGAWDELRRLLSDFDHYDVPIRSALMPRARCVHSP